MLSVPPHYCKFDYIGNNNQRIVKEKANHCLMAMVAVMTRKMNYDFEKKT